MTIEVQESTPIFASEADKIKALNFLDQTLNGNNPLHERFRALFTLKSIGDLNAINVIAKAFSDSSSLLKHEVAYVLGQMKNPDALPILTSVLEDLDQDPMVRHEAAEAIGAIGDRRGIPVLKKYLSDPHKVVSQTCELAIDSIEYSEKSETVPSAYSSIDPAPAMCDQSLEIPMLQEIMMNVKKPLFERYRAMFELRNRGTEEAVLALATGFEDSSELFRHEIAYVFGQMQHPASVPSLVKTLENMNEVAIVRHECAEALGSVATPECYQVLKKYVNDPERVVRESCLVALDMYEHETSGELHYADGVVKSREILLE